MELATRHSWHPSPQVALDNVLASAEGLYAVDRFGRVVYWNEMAEQILGFSEEEVLGRQCSEVMGGTKGDGRPLCSGSCASLAAARRGRKMRHDDLVVRHSEGRPVAISVSTLVLHSSGNEFHSLLHVIRDVAREKRVEVLLYKLVKALESEPTPVAALAPPVPVDSADLTRREIQVLRLLADGTGTKGLAEQLSISSATARHHIDSVMSKLGVHSRLEAVAHAIRHGLLES